MKHAEVPPRRRTGRPLSFDRHAALNQAMLTFWRHGYETTTIADLTTAMRVTAPSLYTAFGDKKQLFLEAMRLYAGDQEAIGRAIDDARTAHAAVRDMLTSAAIAFTGQATPKGCLLASATATGSAASADVQRAVADIRQGIQTRIAARIDRDIADGLMPSQTPTPALSGLAIAVIQGMSVLARDGATRTSLIAIAAAAMATWPRHDGERAPRRAAVRKRSARAP